jgi:hypothetical protein
MPNVGDGVQTPITGENAPIVETPAAESDEAMDTKVTENQGDDNQTPEACAPEKSEENIDE